MSQLKLASLIKGVMYVALVSDSYKVLLYKVLLGLFPSMLGNSSSNDSVMSIQPSAIVTEIRRNRADTFLVEFS